MHALMFRLLFLLLLLQTVNCMGQICNGVTTVVWKDDFGSGSSQLSLQTSPNITSGYTFENNGVNPGHYALVNRFDYFNSWHVVAEDNTPGDTNGYFLVIDGNSAAPIFYETVVNNVCPFTQYSFSTAAMNIDLPQFSSNQTFTFIISDNAGTQLATWTSPPVTVTDQPLWVPLGFNFNSGNNNLLKLQVKFNETGYDDFAFDDFQFSVCGPTLNINSTAPACSPTITLNAQIGSGYVTPVYQWQKKNTAGTFEDIAGANQPGYVDNNPSDSNTYQLVIGDGSLNCPTKKEITVNTKSPKRTQVTKSICQGDSYAGHSTTGVYLDTFPANNGCDSIITLNLTVGSCPTSLSCNNWLYHPSASSSVGIGDLDIAGNQITVEAVINRTTAYLPGGGDNTEGDVVSKHNDFQDVNYLLRPNHAYITTTAGFFATPDVCDLQLNKTYHIAMVYNGSTLKFYRDGLLMSQVAATGNLILNNWDTRIGHYQPSAFLTQFIGYTNEVRIWNVARTQAEIQAYMDASLPNPTTQPGLQAYYIFDDLINKQGNASWNGILNGPASINATNTNCAFLVDSCPLPPLRCNNWLSTPSQPSYVGVGQVNVTGNNITVEAVFNRTQPYLGGLLYAGDLVSKHNTPVDCNYLLRPNSAEITTTNGYFITPGVCEIELNKTYHAAMVYDGATLKFYRNGILMSQVAATGNLVQNNWETRFGWYEPQGATTNFIGFMNEVRIWNVAKTQSQLQAYLSTSLPNPTTQPGLLAYYTFDNLLNKQGNAAYNGTLSGAATINATNTNCAFIIDSCRVILPQFCRGSLGAPVVNVTFGAGALNPGPELGTAVPGASTNYNFANYATGTPPAAPIDGDYALVNQVPLNGAWHTGATDHTGNPNGYMAFFNSAPSPGDFYRQTVANLCPGTTYEFAAWVANVINASVLPSAVFPNLTFKILDPITLAVLATYNTGDIAHFNQLTWKQYSFLFQLPAGNSSVTLVIANNNIGGGAQPGNDLVIDDITFRPCGPLTQASFAAASIVDSAGTTCNAVNLFGIITGSFNSAAYQWQISTDNGTSFSDIAGANALNASTGTLANGQYVFRLLSAEAGNINSVNCRFISNTIKFTVTGCTTTGINNIINDYTPVTAIDFCSNKLTVENGNQFNAGDTVVLIQMKGANIDDRISNGFGAIVNYGTAGAYEFNLVKSKSGNLVELANVLQNGYDANNGRVQLVRVPYYATANVTGTITCPAWDGKQGGIVVLNSATDINLNASIDVSGKGFRGGQIGAGFSCNNINLWAEPTGTGGTKGEGIAEYRPGLEAGGGKLANGGGGAYSANTGGGGGANFGAGGLGGNQSNTCPAVTQSIGGEALDYTSGTRVFAGGGGGGGQQDDGQPVAQGGAGGGIVILKAATLNANNKFIKANGEDITTLVRDEGGAGGGAGGSVLFFVNGYSGNLQVEARGGVGSSNDNIIYPLRCHGPGAGGGGGYIGYSNATAFSGITSLLSGGKAGIVLNSNSACFNTSHGATDGSIGGSGFNLQLPLATVPFRKNIDSVKINQVAVTCKTYDFKGLAFTNTSPVQNWQWTFGDNTTANTQDATHTYNAAGSYNVKLVVTDINGCKDSASAIVQPAGINFDFVLQQDVCNPTAVHFKAVGDTTAEIYWSLGDGTIINNRRNPLHTYADTGFYNVQYSTGNGLCVDTVKKRIYIGYTNGNIIATPDTTICFGTNKLLRSSIDSTLQFCWAPSTYLNNPAFANPTTTPPASISYSLTSEMITNNFVPNDDFSEGNVGFTSGYTFNNAGTILQPGQYTIATNAGNAGPGAANCTDHTTGTGNMLVANSAANQSIIWQQSIAVVPNTNYLFSAWVQSVNNGGRSMLSLQINGNTVADSIRFPAGACTWKKVYVVWNSGNNNLARLGIRDITIPGVISGLDQYALDDIAFGPYQVQREIISITVDTPLITTRADTAVCQSVPVSLNTTGANTYSWSPAAGLSNNSIANPVATPAATTTYFVTGINRNGCSATDSVTITVKPLPVISITADTIICRNNTVRLIATGGGTYAWSPAASLNNASIANPIAAPTANTTYKLVVTGSNNCSSSDSVIVRLKPLPNFSVSANGNACAGAVFQLNAGGGDRYLWSPADLVSDPAIRNPRAITNTIGDIAYSVIIRDTTCGYTDTLNTTLRVLPLPDIAASKKNDVNCSVGATELNATGGLQYTWSPAAGLNNVNSNSPIASPTFTTRYTVKGTAQNGCSNTDTVTVIVDFTGRATYAVPNAFSPNGDNINDCFRLKYFGLIQELKLQIYNRFGNLVFETSNPADCWDGYYKGNPAEGGNYVYYLKAQTACGPVEKKGNLLLIR